MRVDNIYHTMLELGFKVFPYRGDDDPQELQNTKISKEEDDELINLFRFEKRIFKTNQEPIDKI